ncbi:MAG: hypothetical protein ACJ74O_11095 [Frankiaceae bacterium]
MTSQSTGGTKEMSPKWNGDPAHRGWPVFRPGTGRNTGECTMKTITIRRAGDVRLTSAACACPYDIAA